MYKAILYAPGEFVVNYERKGRLRGGSHNRRQSEYDFPLSYTANTGFYRGELVVEVGTGGRHGDGSWRKIGNNFKILISEIMQWYIRYI